MAQAAQEHLSLQVFKNRVNVALSDMVSGHGGRRLDLVILKVYYNPNESVISKGGGKGPVPVSKPLPMQASLSGFPVVLHPATHAYCLWGCPYPLLRRVSSVLQTGGSPKGPLPNNAQISVNSSGFKDCS